MDLITTENLSNTIYFTSREHDVLKLLTEGKANPEIAKELFISVHTVKAVLEHIYEKTGYHNRVQVAVFAVKNKLVN